ncbi:MAG: pilus assembly PilX N-terminal domain-containing protein [Clostridiales bacterium]
MLKNNKPDLHKFLKSQNGSALIMAVLSLIVLSLIGSSIVMLTMNNFQMSIFYSEYNKTYFMAESGVERIAKVIDEKVTAIQEEARVNTSSNLQNNIQDDPLNLRSNNDGSVNYDALNNEFNTKYLEFYYQGLKDEFETNVNLLEYRKELLGTTEDNGIIAYYELEDYGGSVYLDDVIYEVDDNVITIEVEGIYNEYKKNLRVKFDLTAQNTNDEEKSEYQVSVKEVLNKKPEIPSVLYKRALLTEKNLLSLGGNLNIEGSVLAFGTIPTGIDGKEDKDARWYDYGGIIAGITPDYASNDTYFGFDSSKTGTNSIGKINITEDAVTMGYIHSLYGVSSDTGDITIEGNSYARSVISEIESNYSTFSLNNVCTLDNLQIDSSLSNFNIKGKYYGLVDAGYRIDGSNSNSNESILEDSYNFKRTSSVVINGDSNMNFQDEVYIGGSSFLVDFTVNEIIPPSEIEREYPYMTGISALKSNRRLYNAFTDKEDGETDEKLFWYDNGYVSPNPVPSTKDYDHDGGSYKLITGNSEETDPYFFPIGKRAMHFKGVWDNIWSKDDLYLAYLNTENISISLEGGKIPGYSLGSVVANNEVYGINDFTKDEFEFSTLQMQKIENYHEKIEDLLNESYNSEYPKLDYVTSSKSITELIDTRFTGENKIEINKPYNTQNGMLFYGKGDIEIKKSGEFWMANDKLLTKNEGIIFVDGNIYIDDSYEFTGTIIASGNIIFLGDNTITHNETKILKLLDTDVNIKGFFKLLEYDIPNSNLERQRITSDTFKIIEWKEFAK